MKVKLKRATGIKGEHAAKGAVVDIPEQDANYLIGRGIAEKPTAKSEEKPEAKKADDKK